MTDYASGRVTIGFSNPYVANHSVVDGVSTFTNAMKLARGVSVSVEPDTADDNNFYADDALAESANVTFAGGTLTLTVDGLFIASEKFIMGLPEAGSDGWTEVGESQSIPYVSVGFIRKWQSNGIYGWTPYVILKNKFNPISIDAETQGESIDFQTEELSATIFRTEDKNKNWKFIGADFASEAEALTALQTKLNYTAPSTETTTATE